MKYKKNKQKPTLKHKEKKMRLKWLKEKKSCSVWTIVWKWFSVINQENYIDQGDGAGTFIWCCSNET